MMGASQPFRTFTKRFTTEREANSFMSSVKSSGHSTAFKAFTESSSSKKGGGGIPLFSGAEHEESSATETTSGIEISTAESSERKEETHTLSTTATILEFTYMPMQTFRLREGGLALSDYAFLRLQEITDNKDAEGKRIVDKNLNSNNEDAEKKPGSRDEANKEAKNEKTTELIQDTMKRVKARQFIKDFGSHVPFGVQTLGGIFIRSMTIRTEELTKQSSLYASASTALTLTSSTVHKNTSSTSGSVGLFSSAHYAQSNEDSGGSSFTGVNNKFEGIGFGDSASTKQTSFQLDVTCYGPNAATQDELYQMLNSNNRTWTVIDRGETDSYLAIWDFVDYTQQGESLQEQCNLLKEVWEEMALTNSHGRSSKLLDEVMSDYAEKKGDVRLYHCTYQVSCAQGR